jgi:hypothetical protein
MEETDMPREEKADGEAFDARWLAEVLMFK